MILYAIIMFVTAAAFAFGAVRIYKGKTDWIHDYHQTKVTDKVGYGRAFGKALGVLPGAMSLSGAIALLGETAVWWAIGVLTAGLLAGILAILRVQKKYNGGVF